MTAENAANRLRRPPPQLRRLSVNVGTAAATSENAADRLRRMTQRLLSERLQSNAERVEPSHAESAERVQHQDADLNRIATHEGQRIAHIVVLLAQTEDIRVEMETQQAAARNHLISERELEQDRQALKVLTLCLCERTLQIIRQRRADPRDRDRTRSPDRRIPRTPPPQPAPQSNLTPEQRAASHPAANFGA